MMIATLLLLANLTTALPVVSLDRITDPRLSPAAWWSIEGKTVGTFPEGALEKRLPAWSSNVMVPTLRLLRFGFRPPLLKDARVVAYIDDSTLSTMSFLSFTAKGVDTAYVLAPSSSADLVKVRVGVTDGLRVCISEQSLSSGKAKSFEKDPQVIVSVDPVSMPNYSVPSGPKSNLVLLRVSASRSARYYSVALVDRSGKLHELSGSQYPIKGLNAIYQFEQLGVADSKRYRSCLFPIGRLDRKQMVKVKVFASPFRWQTFWNVANAPAIRSEP